MSDPSEILKKRLEAVLDGQQDARGLHFFCQIGGAYHDYGMLTLQVSGPGRILLGWRKDEDSELFSVQLLERDQLRFYQMLVELPFWESSPVRRARRDDEEYNIHIRLSDQLAGTWSGLQFWSYDVKEFPVLQDLLYRICKLTQAISQGDIALPALELGREE